MSSKQLSQRPEITYLRDCLLVSEKLIALKVEHIDIAENLIKGLTAKYHYVEDEDFVFCKEINQIADQQKPVIFAFDEHLPRHLAESFIIECQPLTLAELTELLQWKSGQYLNDIAIPTLTIELLAEWVTRYYPAAMHYNCALDMLTIAVQRALEDKQLIANLEPKHVAAVIADWQQVDCELMFDSRDQHALEYYLTQQVLGQSASHKAYIDYCQKHCFANLPSLLLFTGESGVGKYSTAMAIAKFYNGHERFCITLDFALYHHVASLQEIKLISPNIEQPIQDLLTIAQQYPHIVLVIKNSEAYLDDFIRLFSQILATGYQVNGNASISFTKATLVLLTNVGSEVMVINENEAQVENFTTEQGLMSVVKAQEKIMEEPIIDFSKIQQTMELPLLKVFGKTVMNQFQFIPFLPLTRATVRQAISNKLKQCEKGFTLTYAPELIEFIEQHVEASGEQLQSIDEVFEQYIFPSLVKVSQIDGTVNLSLNETGQWIVAVPGLVECSG